MRSWSSMEVLPGSTSMAPVYDRLRANGQALARPAAQRLRSGPALAAMRGDRLDEDRLETGREIVPHAVDHHQLRAGDVARGVAARLDRHAADPPRRG